MFYEERKESCIIRKTHASPDDFSNHIFILKPCYVMNLDPKKDMSLYSHDRVTYRKWSLILFDFLMTGLIYSVKTGDIIRTNIYVIERMVKEQEVISQKVNMLKSIIHGYQSIHSYNLTDLYHWINFVKFQHSQLGTWTLFTCNYLIAKISLLFTEKLFFPVST